MGVRTINATLVLGGVDAAGFTAQQLQAVASGVQQQQSFADPNVQGSYYAASYGVRPSPLQVP